MDGVQPPARIIRRTALPNLTFISVISKCDQAFLCPCLLYYICDCDPILCISSGGCSPGHRMSRNGVVVGHGGRGGDWWVIECVMSSVCEGGSGGRCRAALCTKKTSNHASFLALVFCSGSFVRKDPADPWIIRELLTDSLFVYFVVRMP